MQLSSGLCIGHMRLLTETEKLKNTYTSRFEKLFMGNLIQLLLFIDGIIDKCSDCPVSKLVRGRTQTRM